MEVKDEVLNQVAEMLQEKYQFATTSQLDKAVAALLDKTAARQARGNDFSLSRMIRGLRVVEGKAPLDARTADADANYTKALSSGSTPGSYLVPTIQANEIIAMLSMGGVLRSSGCRIWDLNGTQKLVCPTALAAPTWIWMAQNSIQTATDPNLGQISFDLKERRTLIAIPNQLLKTSVPAFDTLLTELIGLAAGEHEDTAFFATSSVSGAPAAIYVASGVTSLNVGGSANGGTLAYSDILAVLAASAAAKAKGPFAWYCSPRTFYNRVLGLIDLQSRPITVPTATQGLYPAVQFSLMGWPVFITPFILENEANGSGTNQSHLIFANPKYIHIAQSDSIEIAISTEHLFDANQTAIRGVSHLDGAVSPAAGVVILKGIN